MGGDYGEAVSKVNTFADKLARFSKYSKFKDIILMSANNLIVYQKNALQKNASVLITAFRKYGEILGIILKDGFLKRGIMVSIMPARKGGLPHLHYIYPDKSSEIIWDGLTWWDLEPTSLIADNPPTETKLKPKGGTPLSLGQTSLHPALTTDETIVSQINIVEEGKKKSIEELFKSLMLSAISDVGSTVAAVMTMCISVAAVMVAGGVMKWVDANRLESQMREKLISLKKKAFNILTHPDNPMDDQIEHNLAINIVIYQIMKLKNEKLKSAILTLETAKSVNRNFDHIKTQNFEGFNEVSATAENGKNKTKIKQYIDYIECRLETWINRPHYKSDNGPMWERDGYQLKVRDGAWWYHSQARKDAEEKEDSYRSGQYTPSQAKKIYKMPGMELTIRHLNKCAINAVSSTGGGHTHKTPRNKNTKKHKRNKNTKKHTRRK